MFNTPKQTPMQNLEFFLAMFIFDQKSLMPFFHWALHIVFKAYLLSSLVFDKWQETMDS